MIIYLHKWENLICVIHFFCFWTWLDHEPKIRSNKTKNNCFLRKIKFSQFFLNNMMINNMIRRRGKNSKSYLEGKYSNAIQTSKIGFGSIEENKSEIDSLCLEILMIFIRKSRNFRVKTLNICFRFESRSGVFYKKNVENQL